MQIDIKNVFNNIFWIIIFKELWDVGGLLVSIGFFTKLFMMFIFSFTTNTGNMKKRSPLLNHFQAQNNVTPLRGLLFSLAHYWALFKIITWALSSIFPSLIDDSHIVGPMNKIINAFDHLLT